MCPSGATFLLADLFQWASTIKIQLKSVGLEQSGLSSSHWKLIYSRYDILKNCWVGVKQQSFTRSRSHDPTTYILSLVLSTYSMPYKGGIQISSAISCSLSSQFSPIRLSHQCLSIQRDPNLIFDMVVYRRVMHEWSLEFLQQKLHLSHDEALW